MVQLFFDFHRKVLRSRAYLAATAAIIAVTVVAAPRVAPTAETASTSGPALLKNERWIGDFDRMAKDRQIRALVVYSKTFYFLDGGRQRGLSYDLLKAFEKFVNQKLKTKTLKVHIVFIPVRRDKLIPGLVDGLGDIAVANLTITPQRKKQLAFSDPWLTGVKELVVTGPARINGLRKKTAKMGLDPNVWFHNVEMAAAKEIGRETVQYVSNIYKYYIAYRMITTQMDAKEQLLKQKK